MGSCHTKKVNANISGTTGKKDFKGRNTAVSHSLLLLRKRGFGSVKPGGARWVLQGPMPTLMGDAARGNSESPN